MLNILQVYYEPRPSGQTTHVLSLAAGLDRQRFRVTVVLPVHLAATFSALAAETSAPVGARFPRPPALATVVPLSLRKLAWPPQALTGLVRLIRSQRFDIIHIHSQEAGLLGRVVARLAGAPAIVYTPQTIDIRRTQWQPAYRFTERTLARITDVVVSVNEADRKRLVQWGISPHKVLTIPNGIDLARFRGPVDVATLRRSLGLDPERPVVMQVGRLSAQKDPLTFVHGAAVALRQRPDAQFVLVGDGPLYERVSQRVIELGLQHQVYLPGWKRDAWQLVAAADIATLTSSWEGTPYTLLEAMAWSRPVVATAVNGCPEMVLDGVTGFLAPAGDPGAWGQRVLELLNDPEQAVAMGKRGRERVQLEFSLQEMILQIASLYSSLHGTTQ